MDKEQYETTVHEMYDRLKKVGYKHNDKRYDYGEKKLIYPIIASISLWAYMPFAHSKIIGRSLLVLSGLSLTRFIYFHFKEQKHLTKRNESDILLNKLCKQCDGYCSFQDGYENRFSRRCDLNKWNKIIKKVESE